MAALKVVLDLNIVLDVLQRREPFYEASAQILALAETGKIEGFLAAHSFTTLFYLMKKGLSAAQARATLRDLLQFLAVAPVDQITVEQALTLPYADFEDAVQMACAAQVKANYLVTRNLRDYETAPVAVIQPAELLTFIN